MTAASAEEYPLVTAMTRLTESPMARTVRISRALREKREETVILETAMSSIFQTGGCHAYVLLSMLLNPQALLIPHRQFLRAAGVVRGKSVDQFAIAHHRHFLRKSSNRWLMGHHHNGLAMNRAQI